MQLGCAEIVKFKDIQEAKKKKRERGFSQQLKTLCLDHHWSLLLKQTCLSD